MSDVLLLMKLRYLNFWRINELKHGTDPKVKKQLVVTVVVYSILILLLGFYAVMFFMALARIGMTDAVTPLAYSASTVIIFIFSLFRAASVLYDKNSFNILVPMPIKKTAIVAERFLSMYIEDFLFGLVIMGISFIVTAMNTALTASYVLTTIVATILLPLFPLTVSAILGSVVSAIGGRLKHKNAVRTILSLLFCFAAIGLNFYTNGLSGEQLDGLFGSVAKAINGAFLSEFFSKSANGDFLPFAMLLLGEVALFALLLFIAGKFFVAISTSITESYSGRKFKKRGMKGNSSFAALLKREIKMYFSSSVYVVNTVMGSILCVVGCVAAIIFKGKIDEFFASISASPVLLAVVAVYMLTLMPASSSSISLEGKYLYILKTMPVKDKEVYNGKLAVSFIILLPGLVASAVILPILFAKNVFDILAFVLIPVSAVLVSVVSGLKIGQRHYNIKWKYEAEVVKNGASTLLGLLVGIALTIVSFLLVFFIKPVWIGTTLITVASLIFSGLMYKSITKTPLSTIE